MHQESDEQEATCRKYNVAYVPAPRDLRVGISRNVRDGILPINGLRHPPAGDTTGWYIWAGGEPSDRPDFFVSLHVEHLKEWCPDAIRFLGLPPGWRFLVGEEHEDVWEDPSLLDV
jgi:hypothetical protein